MDEIRRELTLKPGIDSLAGERRSWMKVNSQKEEDLLNRMQCEEKEVKPKAEREGGHLSLFSPSQCCSSESECCITKS